MTLKEASLGADFPQAIEEIVATMLAKSPDDRYQNLGIAAHDLGALRRGESIAYAGRAVREADEAAEQTISMRSNRFFALLLGIAAMSAVLTGASLYLFGYIGQGNSPQAASKIARDQSGPAATITGSTSESTNESTNVSGAAEVPDDEYFAKMLRANMETLDHVPPLIHNQSLAKLDNFEHLNTISLSGCQNITADGLKHIAFLPSLKNLDLTDTKINDDAVPWLDVMKNLRRLTLDRTDIDSKGLKILSLDQLESLSLSGNTKITNDAFDGFERFHSLKRLTLDDCSLIGDDGLWGLAKAIGPQLNELSLKGTNITNGSRRSLVKMPNLKRLSITNLTKFKFTGDILDDIVRAHAVPELVYLNLSDCPGVTESAVKAFEKCRPNCKVDF